MASKSGLMVILISIGIALLGGIAATGVLSASKTIGSSGRVKAINVGVYWDSACTNTTTAISWGTIEPNSTVTRTVYVKNTGNSAMTLQMTTSDWDPSGAGSYITLSWNREDASLDPDSVVSAILTMHVSSSVTGVTDFTLNIVIEGTG